MSFNTKISSILGNMDSLLVDAEDKLRRQASKGVTKLKSRIPTEKELKSKYSYQRNNSNTCSLEGLNKSEKDYNRLKRKLNSVKNALKGGEKGLKSVEKKCNKVIAFIEKIIGILTTIGGLIATLKGVILAAKITLQVIGSIFVPPPTGGTLIAPGTSVFLKEKLDGAAGKIKAIGQTIKTIEPELQRYLSKAFKLIGYLAVALAAVIAIKNLANFIIGLLETLYLGQLQKCAAINSNDGPTNPNNSGTAGLSGNRFTIKIYAAITNNINQYPETNPDDWNLINTLNTNEIPKDNIPEWAETEDYIIEDQAKIIIDSNGGLGSETGIGKGSDLIGNTPEDFLNNIGYNEDTIQSGVDPLDFSDPLADYYNDVITNVQLSGNTEILERIFNANFTVIGYRRYKI